MKRMAAVVALVGVAAAGVLLVQHFTQDRRYRDLLATGEQALASGDHGSAVEAFSGAIALRPDSMVGYYRRGEAYRAEDRDDEALRDLKEALRLAPDAIPPLIELGDLFADLGDPAKAAEWYDRAAARLNDQRPDVLYKLALARYRAGSPAAAIDPLRKALQRNDSAGEAQYLLGVVYRDTRNSEAAVSTLEQAVRVAPGLIQAHEELADLYRALGRPVDEMRQLQALATLDRGVHRTIAIGLAQARQGQYDAAIGTLSAAASETRHDSSVQLALARVELTRAEQAHDRASAARALDVLRAMPLAETHDSTDLALWGRALYLTGDYAGAERTLRDAVAVAPVEPDALRYLADAAEHQSHVLEARDALMTLDALEGDTASTEARMARGRRIGALSLRGGDAPAAAQWLTRATDTGGADAATYALLARARVQSGDRSGARQAVDKGLTVDRSNADLLRLLRILR